MKRFTLLALVAVLSVASGRPGKAHAQPRPVGLVHGIRSSASTWGEFLSAASGISGYTFPSPPSLSSESGLALQAGELLNWKATHSLGTSLILVGHSQGALIARLASRSDSVSGIVTIGAPHLGAWIAASEPYVDDFLYEFAISAASVGFLGDVEWYDQYYVEAQQALADSWLASNFFSVATAAGYAISRHSNPSAVDLSPGSQLLAGPNGLNTAPLLERAGSRLGIVAQLAAGYEGGPLRLLDGVDDETADEYGYYLLLWSFQLEYDAMDLFEIEGFWHQIAVWGLIDLGTMLWNFAPFWTYTVVGGYPNDAAVPSYSQAGMPNQSAIPSLISSVSHTQETKQWAQIMNRVFLVP